MKSFGLLPLLRMDVTGRYLFAPSPRFPLNRADRGGRSGDGLPLGGLSAST